MRALVVSDIHANRAAFEAVLEDGAGDYDHCVCLGDLVGYGPDPDEVVERAREACDVILGGNHDLAACGRMGVSDFSSHARTAMEWTRSRISDSALDFLRGLPSITEEWGLLLSHGSPAAPVWGYILSAEDAAEAFSGGDFPLCLFGHTHVPSAFSLGVAGGRNSLEIAYGTAGSRLDLAAGRWLLNPGSVGFPRDAADAHSSDGERRAVARYGLIDTDSRTWEFRRVEYDLRETARRMRSAGLW
jgi:predicted phosphodiesterase